MLFQRASLELLWLWGLGMLNSPIILWYLWPLSGHSLPVSAFDQTFPGLLVKSFWNVIRQHLKPTVEVSWLCYNLPTWCFHYCIWKMPWYMTFFSFINIRTYETDNTLEHCISRVGRKLTHKRNQTANFSPSMSTCNSIHRKRHIAPKSVQLLAIGHLCM